MCKTGYVWVVLTALLTFIALSGMVLNIIVKHDWVIWLAFTFMSAVLMVGAIEEMKEGEL